MKALKAGFLFVFGCVSAVVLLVFVVAFVKEWRAHSELMDGYIGPTHSDQINQ